MALFDELIVLAKGRCVWAGPMRTVTAPQLIEGGNGDAESEVQGVGEWLESIGKGCPVGFNLADYLSEFSCSPCRSSSSGFGLAGFLLVMTRLSR